MGERLKLRTEDGEFGGVNNITVGVDIAPKILLEKNTRRRTLVLENQGLYSIWFVFGVEVDQKNAFCLDPNKTLYFENAPVYEICGFCKEGRGVLCMIEIEFGKVLMLSADGAGVKEEEKNDPTGGE